MIELKADYLDKYEAVHVQIHQVSQFNDSGTVSTTYLGKLIGQENMS